MYKYYTYYSRQEEGQSAWNLLYGTSLFVFHFYVNVVRK